MSGPAHLSPGEIHRLVSYLPPREQASLAHIADCLDCRQALRQLLGPPPQVQPPAPSRRKLFDYSEVWAGLETGLAKTVERVAAERRQAGAAVAELLALPSKERAARLREEACFRTIPIASLLFERSLAAAAGDPGEAENLALLGIFLLGRLDPDREPQLLVHELRARGWALVAHACFLSGDWPAVREAIENADEALSAAGYGVERPAIRRLVAAIRLSERQAAEVFELVGRAIQLLLRALLGEPLGGGPGRTPAAEGASRSAPVDPPTDRARDRERR